MGKIKLFIESEKGKDVLVIIIVILVGLGSFELGRLSKGNQGSGIKIEYPNQDIRVEANVLGSENHSNILQNVRIEKATTNKIGRNFFASNRGSKYYPSGCSAGQNIKQENRVYFSSSSEAEDAGYALSSSCK